MDRRMDGVGVGVLEVWKQLKLDHWVQNQGGKTREGGRTYRREEAENKKNRGGIFRGSRWKKSETRNSGEMFLTRKRCSAGWSNHDYF